ncbi:hypothetical protein LLG95_10940 [bacterium]|nr:hypothetical protein [bacterium]
MKRESLTSGILNLAVLICCAAMCFNASAQQPPASPARILHFPADRVLGQIFINTHPFNEFTRNTGGKLSQADDYEWKFLAMARGDVTIPPGKLAALRITAPFVFSDLSALRNLKPDDLYLVSIIHRFDKSPAGFDANKLLEPLAGLTGLKSLALEDTTIGTRGLRLLPNFKALERLTMPYGVTDTGLSIACGLPTLKVLHINGGAVTDASVPDLAKLTRLEELRLIGTQIRGENLSSLASLKNLRTLWVNGDKDFNESAAMGAISRLTQIKSLNPFSYQLTDRGLAQLAASPSIEKIELYWDEEITDAGIESLLRMRSIKALDLSHAKKITRHGIATLARIPTLEAVELPYFIDDDALIAFAKLPRIRSLTALGNSSPFDATKKPIITARGLKALADKGTMEGISVTGTGIDDAAMAQIGRMTRLKQLELKNIFAVTDAGLAQLSNLKSLEYLYIQNRSYDVTISGLKAMGTLPNFKFAQLNDIVHDGSVLDLSGWKNMSWLSLITKRRGVNDADMACFAEFKNLRALTLMTRDVTDRGLASIAGLDSLEIIQFGVCNAGDEGMKSLARLKGLQHLAIGGNIGDAGLAELSKLRCLCNLNLTSPAPITDAGMALLRSMPLTRFQFTKGAGPLGPSPKVGEKATNFFYFTLDGKELELRALKGKVVMLHFWAPWDKASYSPAEIARLRQVNAVMSKKYPGRFLLLSIALDSNDARWRDAVAMSGMDWPQGRTGMECQLQFSFEKMPCYYLYGPDRKVLLNPASSWKDTDAVIARALRQ